MFIVTFTILIKEKKNNILRKVGDILNRGKLEEEEKLKNIGEYYT